MKKKRIIISIISIVIIGVFFSYKLQSKFMQNIVKNYVLHKIGIVNNDWEISTSSNGEICTTTLKSASLLIDDIYYSMEGPAAYKRFKLNENEDQLYWVKGFEANANSTLEASTNSNDLICHVNFYHSNIEHFARMGLHDRIGVQPESQLITLTTGALNVEFPKGFAYPVFSNEKILVGSQALNLNEADQSFLLNYDYKIHYTKKKGEDMKPLYMKYLVMALPYENDLAEQKHLAEYHIPDFVTCAGPTSKTIYKTYDTHGQTVTAFWKVPTGKHTYVNQVNYLLKLKKPETIHYINAHVHPYAKSLELIDATTNVSLFKSNIRCAKNKKGIMEIPSFSSEEGITVYPDHDYKLLLEVDNTTNEPVEMMASFYVYFHDQELSSKLETKTISLID